MMNALIPLSNLDSVFDGFFTPHRRCHPTNGHTAQVVPHADILEGDNDYQIRLEVPGFSNDDLSLEVEDQVLTIKAQREQEIPEGYKAHRKELLNKQAVRRSFNLGKEIDADNISAKLEGGILVVTLPKTEKVLPRRIEVK
ncbi:MAG: Hsp20/alpha crystallin family protein [bacterium]